MNQIAIDLALYILFYVAKNKFSAHVDNAFSNLRGSFKNENI